MRLFVGLLKFVDEILIAIGLIILAVVVYLAWVLNTADNVGELLYQNAQKTLTASSAGEQGEEAELAPIANYASYRRCGSSVFSARLTGEPLACSASNFTDTLLRDPGQLGQTFYRQFGTACNRHDFCYIHGSVTYGSSRADCDKAFLADNLKTCKLIYWSGATKKVLGVPWPLNFRRYCEFRASVGYMAVRALGWQYFYDNYSPVCDYEGGPHAVRDQVITGKFLDGDQRDYIVSLSLMKDFDTIEVKLLRLGADGQSEEVATNVSKIVASKVPVLDRDLACQELGRHGSKDKLCPQNFTLGATLVTAKDWLRFNPVVTDHDGDGKDEVILVSVSPDFGLGLTHLKFTNNGGTVDLSASAYLGADRRFNRDSPGACEWGLEFNNCFGALTLRDTGRLQAPGQYRRAVKKLAVATEELKEAEQAGDADKIKKAKDDIAAAEKTIGRTKAYKDPAKSADIRSWRKEMADAGYEKTSLREENHFILTNDGTDQKATYRLIPLRVKKGDEGGWAHDLVLMSAHGFIDQSGDEDTGHVFRNFHFDRDKGEWTMTRDYFAWDGHPVARCTFDDEEDQWRYDQYRRYQYRAFPMRLKGFGNDRLATFQREKCPTSTINASAGSLGDVDVMVYAPDKKYTEINDYQNPDWRERRKLKIADTSWFPLIWSEAAHPLMASEYARENGVHIVGTYVGGASKFTYPIISMLRDNQELQSRLLQARSRRLPDTHGLLAERYYLRWAKEKYGYPETYFELPSVLASVGSNGGDGLSLVYFNNPATAVWEKNISTPDIVLPEEARPATGTFWALVVPLGRSARKYIYDTASLVECPVSGVLHHGSKKFQPQLRYVPNQSPFEKAERKALADDWKKHFLRHEPVLTGNFMEGGKGGLAVAWRDGTGKIAATAFYHDGTEWRFGNESCKVLDRIALRRLY